MSPAPKVLILQHQDDAPAGLVLEALAAADLDAQTVRLDRAQPLPDPASVAIAVSLGSEASADDPSRRWIATELDWLRAADRAGTRILGLCFGAQALALALGGDVNRAARPELGWVRVQTVQPEVIAPGPWLTWHDDEITPPPGAQLLAHNDSGVQAFAVRGHLGVQFHPEVTPEIVGWWVRESRDRALDAEAMLARTAREFPRAAADAGRLFSGFLGSAQDGRSSRSRSR
jgi:GMP synthase-like glutamine amidotransferase